VSDPVPERRALALKLGATHAIDPTADDVVSVAHDLTESGVGVDYAFDAAGRSALVEVGINATRTGGMTVLVGVAPLDEPLHYPSATIFAAAAKQLVGCLLGSANSLHEIPRLVALWQAGRLDLESLITARCPLDDINAAVDDLRASRGVRTVIEL
jgi:Zn-dependent alcohol dehydrogenase